VILLGAVLTVWIAGIPMLVLAAATARLWVADHRRAKAPSATSRQCAGGRVRTTRARVRGSRRAYRSFAAGR
jgi:hypothetical protein